MSINYSYKATLQRPTTTNTYNSSSKPGPPMYPAVIINHGVLADETDMQGVKGEDTTLPSPSCNGLRRMVTVVPGLCKGASDDDDGCIGNPPPSCAAEAGLAESPLASEGCRLLPPARKASVRRLRRALPLLQLGRGPST